MRTLKFRLQMPKSDGSHKMCGKKSTFQRFNSLENHFKQLNTLLLWPTRPIDSSTCSLLLRTKIVLDCWSGVNAHGHAASINYFYSWYVERPQIGTYSTIVQSTNVLIAHTWLWQSHFRVQQLFAFPNAVDVHAVKVPASVYAELRPRVMFNVHSQYTLMHALHATSYVQISSMVQGAHIHVDLRTCCGALYW